MPQALEHRILELHSTYAWDFNRVRRAMDFARDNGMNAICLHRNDFVDKLVYPACYVGGEGEYKTVSAIYNDVYASMYRLDPLSRDLPYRSGVYLRLVLSEARKRGLAVYIENKEISFPDYMELLHPSLRKQGALCPCEPFLLEYLQRKYEELFRLYPDIAGIITSLSTSESKTSFAVNHCTCDICKTKETRDWYREVVGAIYRPIHKAGARLILRDFVFDQKAQEGVAHALDELPEDIVFCLKNTPHDYYPTFPHNARIGKTPGHAQWVEYDVLGQYYGLGVGMAVMVEDIRSRLAYARKNGVQGILVRTCWEGLYGASVFDTPNMVSLYAIAAFAGDPQADTDEMYGRWLQYRGFYRAGITPKEKARAIQSVRAVLDKTWEVLRRTAFMNQCVFSDSSCYPAGMEQAFWLGEVKNSLRDWEPERWDALSAESEENIRLILREKDEALVLVEALCQKCRELSDGLTEEGVRYLGSFAECYRLYVQGFRALGKGAILTRYFVTQDVSENPAFADYARTELRASLQELARMEGEFLRLWEASDNHYFLAYLLLDPERMRAAREDFEKRLQDTAF